MLQLDGKVSIIIPGFNEEKTISNNLVEAYYVFKDIFPNFEIIFVNDGSTDNTLGLAQSVSLHYEKIKVVSYKENEGKGRALQVGTHEASGKYIVFMDADLELPPSQLPVFFTLLLEEKCDVVIGSKIHPRSDIHYPRGRKFVSYTFFTLIALLFNQKFHDTQTGLKLFKSEVIKPVMKKIKIKRYAFDLEMMVILAKQGFKIVESPVIIEFKRELKWGRIKIKDIIQVFFDTLIIFYRYHFTSYYNHI